VVEHIYFGRSFKAYRRELKKIRKKEERKEQDKKRKGHEKCPSRQ